MEIYGRIVTTHGWAYVLTVLSPAGAAEICQVIGEPDGVMTHYRVGELPQYQEQREGALNAMIEKYQIRVLKAEDWQKKKAEIGKAAFLRLPVQSFATA